MRWLANGLVALFSILATLVAFEYFLVWESRFDRYPAVNLTINAKDYAFHYPVKEILQPALQQSRKSRIYLLGDSFVAGIACVQKQQDLSGHLQRLVGHRFAVVNLGVAGKDPSNYIDFLAHFPIHRGDKVVVVLYDNDIHMSRESCELAVRQESDFAVYVPKFCRLLSENKTVPKDEEGVLRRANQVLKRFKIFELVKESAYNLPYLSQLFYRTEYVSRWADFDAEENRWIQSTIRVMKRVSEEKGAAFLLLYYPNTNAISDDDPRHAIWLRFIEHVRQTTQVEVGDPYPFFIQEARNKAMVWSLTDKHPSCEAHSIMAQYLHKFISAPQQ